MILILTILAGFFCNAVAKTQLSVHLSTWNVGDQSAPAGISLEPWLGVSGTDRPDIIAISFLEISGAESWRTRVDSLLQPEGYEKLTEQSMGAILELVYAKKPLIAHISGVQSTYKGTGFLRLWHNKGGVSVRFDLGGHSFVIVNSHLAAGQNNVDDRVDDYQQIIKHHYFHGKTQYILDHDYVFWMGDLNFRLEGVSKAEVESKIQTDLNSLLKYDQLGKAMKAGTIFKGFQEGDVKFQPSYKFDKGTDRYDTSNKQRVPSWTDRILWRTNPSENGLQIVPGSYESYMQYRLSDHKPVSLNINVIM